MRVKFWNADRMYKSDEKNYKNALEGCLKRGEFTLGYYGDGGNEIAKFEAAFAKFVGAKHAVMCGSGTQALHLAYRAAGVGPGDEVITVSHTFIATIDQIASLGAKPVLVDIECEGVRAGLMDPRKLEAAITKRTKLIVPVHLEGNTCDMKWIRKIARRHGIAVVEDAAQAIGAVTNTGKRAGTVGLMGCYSFYPAKVLGCFGNAGAVVTDDLELAERLRLLRCNYNIGKNPSDKVEFGYNLEPDAIHAAVLNVQIKKLPGFLNHRKKIAEAYTKWFAGTSLILPPHTNGRVWQDYVIRHHNRDRLAETLKKLGVGALGVGLRANHSYPALGLNFTLPKSEEYLNTQIRLPCNPNLTDEEISYVVRMVKKAVAIASL